MVTLNVAVNSYSNAVLTLLVSNQFVELKSAVFKKFERDNLYQLACADVVERVQLAVYVLLIGWRNAGQLGWQGGSEIWDRVIGPLLLVWASEVIVDGTKHAFIAKFNHISPAVYSCFKEALAADLDHAHGTGETDRLMDQSPVISRKIGFSVLPLTCLVASVQLFISP